MYVKLGDVGFDGQHGGAVKHIDVGEFENQAGPFDQAEDGPADGVGPAVEAGGKYAVRDVVEGVVEDVDEDQVREAVDALQAGFEFRVDPQFVAGSRAGGLDWGAWQLRKGGLNDPNGFQRIVKRVSSGSTGSIGGTAGLVVNKLILNIQ